MKRLNFNIEESQYEWLSQWSEELGISISEIIRRALKDYIKSGALGETVAGWEAVTEDDMPFEDEIVHRLAMLEGLVMNLFPEKRRQFVYDYALGYADGQLGIPLDEKESIDTK